MKYNEKQDPFSSKRINSLIEEGSKCNEAKMLSPKRQFQFSNPMRNIKSASISTNQSMIKSKDTKNNKEIKSTNQSYDNDPYWQRRANANKAKLDDIKKSKEEKERFMMRDKPLLSRNSQLIVKRLRSASETKTKMENVIERKQMQKKKRAIMNVNRTVDMLFEKKMNEIHEEQSVPIQSLLNNNNDDNEYNDEISNQMVYTPRVNVNKMKKSTQSLVTIPIPYQTNISQPMSYLNNSIDLNDKQMMKFSQSQSLRANTNNNEDLDSLSLIRQHLFDYYNNKQKKPFISQAENQHQNPSYYNNQQQQSLTIDNVSSSYYNHYPYNNNNYNNQINYTYNYQHQHLHQQQLPQRDNQINTNPSTIIKQSYPNDNNQHPLMNQLEQSESQMNEIESKVVYSINSSQQLKGYNPISHYREENNKRLQDLEQLRSYVNHLPLCAYQQEMSLQRNHCKKLQEEQFDIEQKEKLRTNLIQNEYSKSAMDIEYLNEKLKQNEKQKEYIKSQLLTNDNAARQARPQHTSQAINKEYNEVYLLNDSYRKFDFNPKANSSSLCKNNNILIQYCV